MTDTDQHQSAQTEMPSDFGNCDSCNEVVDYFICTAAYYGRNYEKQSKKSDKFKKLYKKYKDKYSLLEFEYQEMKALKEENEEKYNFLIQKLHLNSTAQKVVAPQPISVVHIQKKDESEQCEILNSNLTSILNESLDFIEQLKEDNAYLSNKYKNLKAELDVFKQQKDSNVSVSLKLKVDHENAQHEIECLLNDLVQKTEKDLTQSDGWEGLRKPLENKLEELNGIVTELNGKLAKFQEENEKLIDFNGKLSENKTTLEFENAKLVHNAEEMKEAWKQLNIEKECLQIQCDELKKSNEDYLRHIEQLNEIANQLNDKIAKLKDDNSRLYERDVFLMSENEKITEDYLKARDELALLNLKYTDLENLNEMFKMKADLVDMFKEPEGSTETIGLEFEVDADIEIKCLLSDLILKTEMELSEENDRDGLKDGHQRSKNTLEEFTKIVYELNGEQNRLREENEKLIEMNGILSEAKMALEIENARLVDESTQAWQRLQVENESLRRQFGELKNTNDEYLHQFEELNEIGNRLNNEIMRLTNENSNLSEREALLIAECVKTGEDLASLNTRYTDLVNLNEGLKENLKRSESAIIDLNGIEAHLNKEICTMKEENVKLSEREALLMAENLRLNEECLKGRDDLVQLNTRYTDLENLNEGLKENLRRSESLLVEFNPIQANLNKEINSLKEENLKLSEREALLLNENLRLNEECLKGRDDLASLNSRYTDLENLNKNTLVEFNQTVAHLNGEICTLKEEYSKFSERETILTTENLRLNGEWLKARDDLVQLKTHYSDLESSNEGLIENLRKSDIALVELNSIVAHLNDELNQFREDNEKLIETRRALEIENTELFKSTVHVHMHCQQLDEEREWQNNEFIQIEYTMVCEQNAQCALSIDQYNAEITRCHAEMEYLRNECEQYRHVANEYETCIEALRREVEAANEKKRDDRFAEDLKADRQKLREENQSLQIQCDELKKSNDEYLRHIEQLNEIANQLNDKIAKLKDDNSRLYERDVFLMRENERITEDYLKARDELALLNLKYTDLENLNEMFKMKADLVDMFKEPEGSTETIGLEFEVDADIEIKCLLSDLILKTEMELSEENDRDGLKDGHQRSENTLEEFTKIVYELNGEQNRLREENEKLIDMNGILSEAKMALEIENGRLVDESTQAWQRLQVENESLRRQFGELKNTNDEYLHQFEELNEIGNRLNNEIMRLTNENSNLSEREALLIAECVKTGEDLASLNTRYTDLVNLNEGLKENLKRSESAIVDLNGIEAHLNKEICTMKEENVKLSEREASLMAENLRLNEECLKGRDDLVQLNTRYNDLENLNEGLKENLRRSESLLVEFNPIQANLNKEINSLKEENLKLSEREALLLNENLRLNEECLKGRDDLASLNSRYTDLENLNKNTLVEFNQTEAHLNMEICSLKEEYSKLSEREALLMAECLNAKDDLALLKTRYTDLENLNEGLKENLRRSESSLVELNQIGAHVNHQIYSLKDENLKLFEREALLMAENLRLNEECLKGRDDLALLNTRYNDLENLNKNTLVEFNQTVAHLNGEICTLKEEYSKFSERETILTTENLRLNGEWLKARDDLVQLKTHYSDLESSNEGLRGQFEQFKKENEEYLRQFEELNVIGIQLNNQICSLKEENSKLSAREACLMAENAKLTEECLKARDDLNLLNSHYTDLENINEGLKENLRRSESTLEELNEIGAHLNGELIQFRDENEKLVEMNGKLSKDKTALETEIAKLIDDALKFNNDYYKIKEENEAAQKTHANLEYDNSCLRDELKHFEHKLIESNKSLIDMEVKYKNLDDQMKIYLNNNQTRSKAIGYLEEENLSLQKEIHDFKVKNETLSHQCADLKAKEKLANDENIKLLGAIDKLRTAYDELFTKHNQLEAERMKLVQMQDNLSTLHQKLEASNKLEIKVNELNMKLDNQMRLNDDLNRQLNELSQLRNDYNQLKYEKNFLNEQIQNARIEKESLMSELLELKSTAMSIDLIKSEKDKLFKDKELYKREYYKVKQIATEQKEKLKSLNVDKFEKEITELREKLAKLTKSNEFLKNTVDMLNGELEKCSMNKENADDTSSPAKTINTKKLSPLADSPSVNDNAEGEEEAAMQAKNGCAQQ